MPLIGENTYKIDFVILENNDPKTIVILDQSNYLSQPEKPLLYVTLPGFTGHIEIPYNINGLTFLNSDNLGLTEECDYEEYANLPDGLYQIRMAVCPYNELYSRQCYLKTTQLNVKYQNLLLTYEGCDCIDEKKLKEQIIDTDILIQSAKAEVNKCNIEKAIAKYKSAENKLELLTKKVNCK